MGLIKLPDELNRDSLGKYIRIIDECEECDGSGDLIVMSEEDEDVGEIIPCECKKRALYLFRLDRANVPKKYRGFGYEDLRPDFVEKNARMLRKVRAFQRDMRMHVAEGNGILFCGPSGVAKSAIASLLAKEACRLGIPCYVDRLANIVSYRLSFREPEKRALVDHILSDEIKLLVLEEVDKARQNMTTSPGGMIYEEALLEILGSVYDSEKSLLVTSNLPLESQQNNIQKTGEVIVKQGLDLIYEPHVIDRFRALEPVYFLGDSIRESQRWYRGEEDGE